MDGKKDTVGIERVDPGYESFRKGEDKGHGHEKKGQHQAQPGTYAETNAEHKSVLLGQQGSGREGQYYFDQNQIQLIFNNSKLFPVVLIFCDILKFFRCGLF